MSTRLLSLKLRLNALWFVLTSRDFYLIKVIDREAFYHIEIITHNNFTIDEECEVLEDVKTMIMQSNE